VSEPDEHLGRILIVDDDPANVLVLERPLELAGYGEVRSTTDPTQFYALYTASCPTSSCSTCTLPVLDGFAVMRGC
jgi:PleD family two-component response regulator